MCFDKSGGEVPKLARNSGWDASFGLNVLAGVRIEQPMKPDAVRRLGLRRRRSRATLGATRHLPGRDLAELQVLYLFVDGIAERLLGQPHEAVLAACDISANGAKVLLGLAPPTKEDTPDAARLPERSEGEKSGRSGAGGDQRCTRIIPHPSGFRRSSRCPAPQIAVMLGSRSRRGPLSPAVLSRAHAPDTR